MALLVVTLQAITLLATVIGGRSGSCDGGMKKVALPLALNTFGLGAAESGIIGVFMELMHNVGILIPAVGYMISYYAPGVVVGAPIIALFSGCYSLKHTLLSLVALCVVGNAMFTLSSSCMILVIDRLVPGFPCSTFFGVGAIMLSKIIKPGKVTAAMTGTASGMTIASSLGIPLGTCLSQEFSWHYTFLLIAVFNIAVMASVYFWVPNIRGETKGKLRERPHFLRSLASWLIFAATMFGNAGVLAWFSYVEPYVMFISGFSETAMAFTIMLIGLGIVLGNMLSGRVSGRYSPLRTATVTDLVIVLTLLMLFFCSDMKATSLIFALICCAGLLALSTLLQMLLLQNTKGGELSGATGEQIVFNLGSIVDIYCGGTMLTLGLVYDCVALPATLLLSAAVSSLLLYGRYKCQ